MYGSITLSTIRCQERNQPINKSGFRSLISGVVPLFMVAHFSHHLVTALPVPLLPFIRDEFGLDYTRAGFVIAAFSITYGIFQLPAGWLADRIGARTLIIISIVGVGIAGILIGLSQNYWMLLLFLVLIGVLGGGYHPASTTLIAVSVEPKNLGRALGFHMVGGSASYFLVPLIAAALAAIWGWRGSFIGLAIPTIAFGVVLYMFPRRLAPTKKIEPETTGSYVRAPYPPSRWRRLITILALGTLTQAVLMSVIPFIPIFLVDNFNVGKEVAAASISLVFAMGLWSNPVGGYLSDRLGSIAMIMITLFLAGPVIYLFNLVPYGAGTSALLIIFGIILYVNTTVAQVYIAGQAPERHRSTMFGIYFCGAMEGAGVLTPAIGYLIDQFGFHTSFTIIGATLLTTAFIGALILWFNRD
ncbi:MFS transporter [Chloroflexota bacterium]